MISPPAYASPGAQLVVSPLTEKGDEPCLPAPASPVSQAVPLIQFFEHLKKLDQGGGDTHLADAIFLFDVRKRADGVSVTGFTYDYSADPDLKQLNEANSLYLQGFANYTVSPILGKFGLKGPAKDFDDYMNRLRAAAPDLSTQAKLSLLSEMGSTLAGCYDDSWPLHGTSNQDIFKDVHEGKACGVCRDIHTYLRDAASALGFEEAGLMGTLWQNGPSQSDSDSHVVSYFRDPKTKEFYVLNYGQIFNTHQKTVIDAVDVGTSVLAPLTGASYVESKPGVLHIYQPRTARWVRQLLEESATDFSKDRTLMRLKMTNTEQTLSFEVGRQNSKAFFIQSGYETSNGYVRLDALGGAGQAGKNYKVNSKYLDEVGWLGNAYLGGLSIATPRISQDSADGDTSWTRYNAFLGGKIAGYARLNPVTGKLELAANALDLGSPVNSGGPDMNLPWHAITASVEVKPSGSPVSGSISRVMEASPKTWSDIMPTLRTAYDKIDVVVDTRKDSAHPVTYVVANGGTYLFGGLNRMDAVGLKTKIRAVVPAGRLGEFAWVFDANGIVSNRSDDPFYKAPFSLSLGAEWEKKLNSFVNVAADLDYTNGNRPFFLFEDPGSVVPELGQADRPQLMGDLWLRSQF